MEMTLINEAMKDEKTIKTGFDWPSFFSFLILGIPHILRGQYDIGITFLVIGVASFFIPEPANEGDAIFIGVTILAGGVALMIYMGNVGRRLYTKHLLKNGYTFKNEDSEIVRHYKQKWNIL